jgi:preprotein translocase subunit SecG
MDSLLIGFQIAVALMLIVVVLLQVKGQGAALFGSAESSYRTRRGFERLLFQFTIGLIVVFIGLSIVIASNRF